MPPLLGRTAAPSRLRGSGAHAEGRRVRPSAAVLDKPKVSHVPTYDDGPSTSGSAPQAPGRSRQGRDSPVRSPTSPVRTRHHKQEPSPSIFVTLDRSMLLCSGSQQALQSVRTALQELKRVGVAGVVVDVWWGLVEGHTPERYDWSAYRPLLALIHDVGLKAKVEFCFHSARYSGPHLPQWVRDTAHSNPDLLYRDRGGGRCADCLTLGVDDVPALAGRTAIQAYQDVMASFRTEFSSLLGGTVVAYSVGAGPDGELRYPSHPSVDAPPCFGVGEFQCYDRYMMASLQACAQQVGQPSWGLAGPHDAGSYSLSPHQSRFFNHSAGSWESEYGRFFLQWYSSKLVQHADRLLTCAATVFGSSSSSRSVLGADVRVPALHWWYGSASHAAELSAGYYNAGPRNGYLPLFSVLKRHGAGAVLTGAEARACEQPASALSQPELLLTQQRVVATALQLPVTLRNQAVRFDDAAMQRLEASLADRSVSQGVGLLAVQSLTFSCLGDAMLEPENWQRFCGLVRRVRRDSEVVVVADTQSAGMLLLQERQSTPVALA